MGEAAARDLVLKETQLAESFDTAEWLDLWDEDGLYWIPIGDPADPEEVTVAIIRDTVPDLRERVARLESGLVHSQVPPSRWSRVWGPLEVHAVDDPAAYPELPGRRVAWEVSGNFYVGEFRRAEWHNWAGRINYLLTDQDEEGLKIFRKTVLLVNRDAVLPPLMFLI